MEELGIGRPSTYAATLQTLKDRDYVRLEKNRFIPEESGRLVTAFLERFFEKYVSYDFTAGLEEELDDISGGRAEWQKVLESFWRDFKPKTVEIMEQKPSEVTAALDEFLSPFLFPDKGDGSDPRLCPACGEGRLALRGGKFGAFVACSNYPDCKFTRRFGQGGEDAGGDAAPRSSASIRRPGRISSARAAASVPISRPAPAPMPSARRSEGYPRAGSRLGGEIAVAAAYRRAPIPKAESRSRRASAATARISPTAANMPS